jgi:hypothetical protein
MAWSYNTGQRGVSWVRAYEVPSRGKLYMEWFEDVVDKKGAAVLDAEGRPRKRRARMQLPHTDTRRAEDEARELSDRFAAMASGGPGTVHGLIDDYLLEVTPEKGESKQGHDRRAARVWKEFTKPDLLAEKMSRTEWDGFSRARRQGGLCELGPVGERQVQYDLKFLVAVLGWGVGTGRLSRHPWGPEVRRTQGWKMPRNRTPRRPQMTDEIRELLVEHGGDDWRFGLALKLARATISRNVSVHRLRWQDVDLTRAEVTWQKEKDGGTYRTPLSPRAVELLRSAPSRGIGGAWVFPAPTNPARHCSRHYFQTRMRRAKARLLRSIGDQEERAQMRERLRGLGFHGEKRAAIRDPEFRRLPAKVREQLARTTEATQRLVYDEVPMEELHEVVRRLG